MRSFKNFLRENVAYEYSCVMFRLPKKITDQIMSWSEENILDKNLYKEHKKGRVSDTHITVLYGLHTNNYKSVISVLNELGPIRVVLGEVSKFENKDFDVIKIDVISKELKVMNKTLKKLKHTTQYLEYIPHCTLAYVKKNSCNHLIGNNYFSGKKVLLKDLYFTPSVGKKVKLKSRSLI